MGTSRSNRGQPPWVARLYLPAYAVREAGRLAGVSHATVGRWFGGIDKRYRRVLSPRKPGQPLSYFELVEVAFVASLRDLGVTLKGIRMAHRYLSTRLRHPYPFAVAGIKTDGVRILRDLEDQDAPWVDRLLDEASSGGQFMWKEPIQDRIREFDYDKALQFAVRWFPRGKDERVVIDPRVQFGVPTLCGTRVPTAIIRERHLGGESVQAIARDFRVRRHEIEYAVRFEEELAAA